MNDQPTNQPNAPREEPPMGMRPEGAPNTYQPSRPGSVEEPAPLDPLVAPMGTPDAGKARPKRKKGVIVAIVIAVLVVLGASAAAAYKFWYQNPDKVIGDALMNAADADSLAFTGVMTGSGETSGSMSLSGALTQTGGKLDFDADLKRDGKAMALKGGGLYDDKGDLYLKLGNIKELVESQMGPTPTLSANAQKIIDDFIAKIDDKWIKVSADELKNFSADMAKKQQCFHDAIKKIQSDKAVSDELVTLYKSNPFLTVKKELGSKDGSLGYEMGEDTGKRKAFIAGLKETSYYKTLQECDESITIDDNATDTQSEAKEERVEVWVSRWSHEFTKVSVVSNESKPSEKSTVTFEPKFNEDVTISAPSESKSLKELGEDFQALQMAIMMEQMQQAQGVQMPAGSAGFSTAL